MFYPLLVFVVLLLPAGIVWGQPPTTLTLSFSDEVPTRGMVRGFCYQDVDSDLRYDAKVDRPLEGVAVSDGVEVVVTAPDGSYRLPVARDAHTVFVTSPRGYRPANTFYQALRADLGAEATYDFALVPDPRASSAFSFVQVSDIQAGGEADLQRLSHSLEEISASFPAPQFIVSTGDHVDSATRTALFQGVAAAFKRSTVPVYSVPGTYDLLSSKNPLAAYRASFGPDYYSVNFGDWHFVFLNSTGSAPYQTRWLERNLKAVGQGKKLAAFQYHVPSQAQLEEFQALGVRAIFSGQWHGTRLSVDKKGLADITQGPLLMGGLDGTPASFRLVRIDGDQLNTELRVLGTGTTAAVLTPDEQLRGGNRLLVNLQNSRGGVKEARFRLQIPGAAPFAEGGLTAVSATSWMAPLDARTNTPENLPSQFAVRVRATGHDGQQWDTSRTVTAAPPALAPKVDPDWPQFMGNAQRNGRATGSLPPPLRLAWVTPTHGTIALSSPILYKKRLAIGVRDTDNLLNNGVAVLDAVSGKLNHFVKTDTMVNHSPAFAEDKEDGPGIIWAATAGGDVLQIDPDSGKMQGSGGLGGASWLYGSPAVQGRLAVLGNSKSLQAFHAQVGEHRWTSPGIGDWPPSFASPTLAGPMLLMGGNWLVREGKPASVYGLDSESGRRRWTIESVGISGSIAVAGPRGFFIDNRGTLVSFDVATGKPLARKALDGGWSLSSPAVDKEVVIAPGGAGTVYAFHPETMERIWSFQAGDSLWVLAPFRKDRKAVFSSPTIAGDFVYLGCSDGNLYCLRKQTGEQVWSFYFGVPSLSTPCVSGNALFTAAMDGNFYAFTTAQP